MDHSNNRAYVFFLNSNAAVYSLYYVGLLVTHGISVYRDYELKRYQQLRDATALFFGNRGVVPVSQQPRNLGFRR
jgi:hypothetical protein